MAKWSDILTLIAVTAPTDETDEYGFYAEATETKREIFANKKSVGNAEFYRSAQAGYTTELKFSVYSHDYGGETLVEHGGKRYKVLRTYESKNGEFVELTLTDLSERAHVSEPEADAGAEPDAEGGGEDGNI